MSDWIIFYITLLNWHFLLKWYNFFWNFCWNRHFLLCTTISIDFNSQISLPLWSRSRKFWNVGVGVRYFTSDSATWLELEKQAKKHRTRWGKFTDEESMLMYANEWIKSNCENLVWFKQVQKNKIKKQLMRDKRKIKQNYTVDWWGTKEK